MTLGGVLVGAVLGSSSGFERQDILDRNRLKPAHGKNSRTGLRTRLGRQRASCRGLLRLRQLGQRRRGGDAPCRDGRCKLRVGSSLRGEVTCNGRKSSRRQLEHTHDRGAREQRGTCRRKREAQRNKEHAAAWERGPPKRDLQCLPRRAACEPSRLARPAREPAHRQPLLGRGQRPDRDDGHKVARPAGMLRRLQKVALADLGPHGALARRRRGPTSRAPLQLALR
mmetsp:Transcript_20473/g.51988  ORF Transcript_20473/g.51988 Transcript_20473/m.51988 type:complete len:226 (-) Transcript_20473:127-804(-)